MSLIKHPNDYAREAIDAFAGDKAAALAAFISEVDGTGWLSRMPRGWIATVAALLA